MELNPFARDFQADPYPTYRWLREHAPLYRNEALDFWALSRFRDVQAALADWATYSSAEGVQLERLDPEMSKLIPIMIHMDPPRHDRLRKLVSKAFTPRRVAELEPFVRQIAERLLEPLVARGGGDFVSEFSAPLPMDVIFTLLHVPEGDRPHLRHLMDLTLERDADSPALPSRALEAMLELARYWFDLVRTLRRQPDDGLVAGLLEAEIEDEHGRPTRLSDGEIVGFCSLLGAAGNETTTRLLANAAVLFAQHPEQYAIIRADPARIPGAVEEVVRHSTPAQYTARTVTREAQWYGTTVPAGARMLLLLGAANRDEREYPDPDTFRVTRTITNPLGFGHGVHYCLGASLARLESRVALEEFARRVPAYVVDEARCERAQMSNVHGWTRVPFATG